jgi:hypothetical protein
MAEKEVFERILESGDVARYHVDFEKSEVFLETGGVNPNTGRPFLRFSSNNTAPFPKTVPVELVDEPEEFAHLFEEKSDPVIQDTDFEFEATPVEVEPELLEEPKPFANYEKDEPVKDEE